MPTANFYLKKAEKKSGLSLIYLQFKYNGYKLLFSFGQNVDPNLWNKKKQRVKSNAITTADKKHSLNDLLKNLEEVCESAYNEEIKNGIPMPSALRKHLVDFINQNQEDPDKPTFFSLAQRFIDNEIKHEGESKVRGTLATYKVIVRHLKDFERAKRYPIDFETITLDFLYRYLSYLESLPRGIDPATGEEKTGLAKNTIAKHVQVIKTFMGEAVDMGYTNNLQFKHKKFRAKWVPTDAVYIKESEIMKLYRHDFSGNPRLEKVRDLFVFGCCTGLRFSDYSDIKPTNIVKVDGEYFIKVVTRKTGELVIIPANPLILEMFNKYSNNANKLPAAPSNQKFNEYIKEACKAAGLDETGRLMTAPEKPLWECISSHTARRSFATNLFLEGYPNLEIMKITGHRTEKAFLTYIKVSKIESAVKLGKHLKLKWSDKILRVAG
jgi:integrase